MTRSTDRGGDRECGGSVIDRGKKRRTDVSEVLSPHGYRISDEGSGNRFFLKFSSVVRYSFSRRSLTCVRKIASFTEMQQSDRQGRSERQIVETTDKGGAVR